MSTANTNIVGKVFKIDSTASGNTAIAKVTIPIDTGFGERKVTTWWVAKFFGKNADTVLRALQKGDWVSVSGQASINKWTARDGSERASAEVDATSFQRVGPRIPREAAPPDHELRSEPRSARVQPGTNFGPRFDDDEPSF